MRGMPKKGGGEKTKVLMRCKNEKKIVEPMLSWPHPVSKKRKWHDICRKPISSLSLSISLSECVLAGLWIRHYWLSNLYKWFNVCVSVCVSMRVWIEPEAILSSSRDGGSREAAPRKPTPESTQHTPHSHGETNTNWVRLCVCVAATHEYVHIFCITVVLYV